MCIRDSGGDPDPEYPNRNRGLGRRDYRSGRWPNGEADLRPRLQRGIKCGGRGGVRILERDHRTSLAHTDGAQRNIVEWGESGHCLAVLADGLRGR